jgi:hypothetical protein
MDGEHVCELRVILKYYIIHFKLERFSHLEIEGNGRCPFVIKLLS